MHLRTILILFVAVGVLGGLTLLGGDDEPMAAGDESRPILDAFDASRVTALRVDFTDRELTFEVQRQRGGRWFLVDPIEFRADAGPVQQVLDLVTRERSEPVHGLSLEAAGLTPPRVEIELTEDLGDGELRRRKIQLGATDVGGSHVFARTAGPTGELDDLVRRVPRGLSSSLELPLGEWRERRLLDVSARDIVGLRRRGTLPEPDGSIDPAFAGELDFDIALEDGVFYSTHPYRVRLHPSGVEPLRLVATGARAERFLADTDSDLARWRLEPPAFTVELDVRGVETERLRVGGLPVAEGDSVENRQWTGYLEGRATVMELSGIDVQLLAASPEQIFDYDLINVLDSDVWGIELSLDGATLSLEREPSGWSVVRGEERLAADGGAIADLAGLLLGFEMEVFLIEPEHREQDLAGRVEIRRRSGEAVGVDLGPRAEYRGVEGRLVRRDGEALWALVAADLDGVARTDPLSLASLQVAKISELDTAAIVLRRGGSTVRFERDQQRGLWRREGEAEEDREFALVVEPLLGPRVRRWLDVAADAVELSDLVVVDVVTAAGATMTFELGRTSIDGEALTVLRAGGRVGAAAGSRLTQLEPLLDR